MFNPYWNGFLSVVCCNRVNYLMLLMHNKMFTLFIKILAVWWVFSAQAGDSTHFNLRLLLNATMAFIPNVYLPKWEWPTDSLLPVPRWCGNFGHLVDQLRTDMPRVCSLQFSPLCGLPSSINRPALAYSQGISATLPRWQWGQKLVRLLCSKAPSAPSYFPKQESRPFQISGRQIDFPSWCEEDIARTRIQEEMCD